MASRRAAMARAFIGVGSNAAPAENLRRALQLLRRRVQVRGISTVYLSEALGRPDQPPYYNCVVEIETDLLPLDLKRTVLRRIETELGRSRTDDKYAPRPIDLDLILYEDRVVNTGELTLPDPEIVARPFLAIPLHELAPELVLPGTGQRIEDVARRLRGLKLKALAEYSAALKKAIA